MRPACLKVTTQEGWPASCFPFSEIPGAQLIAFLSQLQFPGEQVEASRS